MYYSEALTSYGEKSASSSRRGGLRRDYPHPRDVDDTYYHYFSSLENCYFSLPNSARPVSWFSLGLQKLP